ncbi:MULTISPECIES: glycosyltransferase family 4 protein [Chryseobacterium]|jgi:UDP-N-acetylmuramyl pentapeptide phosphotransferase/UDP-N-acetylglucosamine-1-phosphate transferase|uniref:UDP-N-acetylmuramyl pentapeptide phosphotransferase/UDP-N-acetylglucosamine-1-phosphate transferase n=1 Tax=Chryseobacterium geocarposphaerae TaxID=1416776 RepID=A0ABU1LHW0_9FLAO|nr:MULTISPECIES: MraY family glycosyltransferase [Chryseobacterium]ALR32409.1 UDP-N-acetylmuramyl pentapeptide phosphotransferase [Chryseobacterium sp. IHB B 17019]MDR6406321.1 UDP-N-acetylmuramyl pentapeptide phosphotransferase/UDP-N-acetylglucosamine-1-phosphate transferase [Chryseobacterium geocarposphaerae]MDR6699658.1 UDP-N-acetylmuramyl pentapeptide phosphotransferase/UDP-N-acetylglucosamine-1-phosphate transferase [Chryseobacterium ginsenosidimutans]
MKNFELFLTQSGVPIFYVKMGLGFLFSFLITFFSVPTIIKISRRKNLMDEPGVRSSHLRKIPNLGGIAIFYSIGICASIFAYELFDLYKFLFASLVILLYVGVMDDIVVMRAYKKLVAQIVVSALIVMGSDIRVRSLFGIFGIYEMGYIVSVIFSIITFIILINAFNLIDGIDGLAGGYSVICSALFGISYYRLGEFNYPLVILSVVIIGAVLGFLYYNLSNYRTNKIFMGDTGSMLLGFLLAFTSICFIDIFIDKELPTIPRYHLQSAPVVAVAILILPIVDTLNVIIIRLANKKSPFDADKNHIHHKLLKLNLTHRRSSFYIILYYLFVVSVAYCFRHINVNLLLGVIVFLGFLGAYIPDFIYLLKNNKKTNN